MGGEGLKKKGRCQSEATPFLFFLKTYIASARWQMPDGGGSRQQYIYICLYVCRLKRDVLLDCISSWLSRRIQQERHQQQGLVSVEHPVFLPSRYRKRRSHKRGSQAKKRTRLFTFIGGQDGCFIVGNPIYMQHRPIYAYEKIFSELIKSPFIFVILQPFDGLYRSTEKLSVRSVRSTDLCRRAGRTNGGTLETVGLKIKK